MKSNLMQAFYSKGVLEAGCDEAGRGCLAGAVYAAAVILKSDFEHPLLNDSKQLTVAQRNQLRVVIEKEALSWAVGVATPTEIDKINILNASFLAMHRAIAQLSEQPQALIIDGNRFQPYLAIPHTCIVKGDSKYSAIAAASILAKTHRDEYMLGLHEQFPAYGWDSNKGYPTKAHRAAIQQLGLTPHHRKSFKVS